MKQNNTLIWIIIGVGVSLGLVFILFSGNSNKWTQTLKINTDEPYDLSLFYSTIKETWSDRYHEIPEKNSIEKSIQKLNPGNNDIYCFAGKNLYLSRVECALLEEYVSKGGVVFFSTKGIPPLFLSNIKPIQNLVIQSGYRKSVYSSYTSSKLEKTNTLFRYYDGYDSSDIEWNYYEFPPAGSTTQSMDEDFEDMADHKQVYGGLVTEVSNLKGLGSDFIHVRYGMGHIYLHANPILFSNYYLKNEEGRNYFSNALLFITGGDLWFDKSAGIKKAETRTGYAKRNIMEFIKSNAALYSAWVILLSGVFLFLLFGGRRKQRAIPVLEIPKNTSRAFADSIGYFYFTEGQNILIFQKEWNQFIVFVKQQFRIVINSNSDDNVTKLSQKSGVNMGIIEDVLNNYEKYKIFSRLSTDELIEFNRSVTAFYTEYKNQYGKSK